MVPGSEAKMRAVPEVGVRYPGRLLPGVLGEEQQRDDHAHAADQEPRRQLDGQRLDQCHLAPLAVLPLEVEGFLVWAVPKNWAVPKKKNGPDHAPPPPTASTQTATIPKDRRGRRKACLSVFLASPPRLRNVRRRREFASSHGP